MSSKLDKVSLRLQGFFKTANTQDEFFMIASRIARKNLRLTPVCEDIQGTARCSPFPRGAQAATPYLGVNQNESQATNTQSAHCSSF